MLAARWIVRRGSAGFGVAAMRSRSFTPAFGSSGPKCRVTCPARLCSLGPAASARLLTRRVTPMIVTSALIAILAGLAGVYSSFYLKTSAGASVVVFILIFFFAAAALKSVRSRTPAIERV